MPRRKSATVYIFTPGPSDAAYAEVLQGIKRLVALANQHDRASWDDARKVERALTALSERADIIPLRAWWPPAAVVFTTLVSLVRRGVFRLRRCSECQDWFVTKTKKRQIC